MSNDFEWLSNNLFVDYPFATPAPKVNLGEVGSSSSSGGNDISVGSIFADAAIYTSDMLPERLKLRYLNLTCAWPSSPTTGQAVLEFEGGQLIVLDPSAANVTFRSEVYGRWVVVEWVLDETEKDLIYYPDGVSVRDVVCRFLLSKDFLENYDELVLDFATEDAWIESSLVKTGPRRVRRMFWKVGDFLFSLGDPVRIEPGFNIDFRRKETGDVGFQLEDTTPVVREPLQLFMDAVPGAGKGRYLRCLPRGFISTISGVGPDEIGDTKLDPVDCYWLEKPLSSGPFPIHGGQVDEVGTVKPHELKLHNACVECCSCEDYLEVYGNLNRLWARAGIATSRVYRALDGYTLLRDALIAKGAGAQSARVLLRSRRGFSFDVSVMFVNGEAAIPANSDLKIELSIDISPSGPSVSYVLGTGMYSGLGENDRPLDPSGSGLSYELDFGGLEMPQGTTLLWQGSFTATGAPDSVVNMTAKVLLDDTEIAAGFGAATLKAAT